MLWLVSTMAVPEALREAMRDQVARRLTGSMPEVGSSCGCEENTQIQSVRGNWVRRMPAGKWC